MKRRTFLRAAGAGALHVGVGLLGKWRASAAGAWGEIPGGVWPDCPSSCPQYKILEIHLYGGLSPWETFYFRPSPGPGARGFDREIADLKWDCSASPDCDEPPSGLETRFFAKTKYLSYTGHDVHLGPFTKPLWKEHILSRMRAIVLRHELLPHEAAIPYTLSGLRLGRPQLAGLGAPIQRRSMELLPRSLPYSYVFVPTNNISQDNLQAATAIGIHPGLARPLALRIGAGADSLIERLGRANMAPSNAADALLRQYRSHYRDQLRMGGRNENPVRSKGFEEYNASVETLINAPLLQRLLQDAPFQIQSTAPCARMATDPVCEPAPNLPGTQLKLAAFLLSRPAEQAARYVCVVDSGLMGASGGGGYDTHSGHIRVTSVNLWSILKNLSALIKAPGERPDPSNPKIDLDDTLIVLNTEFGRTPIPVSDGRDHFTEGYVNVLIGGPVRGPAVIGEINDATSVEMTQKAFTATDIRAGVLLAAGINPLDRDVYNIGDVSCPTEERNCEDPTARLISLRKNILGIER